MREIRTYGSVRGIKIERRLRCLLDQIGIFQQGGMKNECVEFYPTMKNRLTKKPLLKTQQPLRARDEQ